MQKGSMGCGRIEDSGDRRWNYKDRTVMTF